MQRIVQTDITYYESYEMIHLAEYQSALSTIINKNLFHTFHHHSTSFDIHINDIAHPFQIIQKL